MTVKEVCILPLAGKMMRYAAVEPRRRSGYLDEAAGELLGRIDAHTAYVEAIYAYGKAKRDRGSIHIEDEESETAWDFFDGHIIGDFHSHPEAYPTASKADKSALYEDYPDGSIMVICGVWPRKRGGYTYRFKAYGLDRGQVYLIPKITLVS